MPGLAALQAAARARYLSITAVLQGPRDDLPDGCQTLLMLSPDEPAFWPAFTDSPEYRDGAPDPMDRWSRRVITEWAAELDARPLFPFGGPPFQPFIAWALASGFAASSPVGMMVHAQAGLYLSFRGALAMPVRVDAPAPPPSPCDGCADRPCLTACPVFALGPGGYDVPACKGYLVTNAGQDCMTRGCAARRACPAGQDHGRLSSHSAFHMIHFL